MALIPFGGNRQLSINIREPNAIQQGAVLHRLTFPVELDSRNTITGGVPVTLSGSAWLSVIGMDWLGTWTTERPVVTQEDQTFDAVLVLSLTDEQLAVVEKKRAGRDLRLTLDANVTLGYDPARADGDQNNRWPAKIVPGEHLSLQRDVAATPPPDSNSHVPGHCCTCSA
jgi:hypothetical protein